jgi:hypothetical protein
MSNQTKMTYEKPMIEMGMPMMILECEQRKLITKMGVPTMLLELKIKRNVNP